MFRTVKALALVGLFGLSSFALLLCGTLPAAANTNFVLEDYFKGKTVAYGRFQSINGIDRRFRVDLIGKWNGRTLTLIEDFTFDDGEKDRKTWTFERISEGRYIGRRSDVEGDVDVRVSGDTVRFNYSLYLEPEEKKMKVFFRDKMTLLENGIVENRASVSKFGLPVANVQVNFARPEDVHALRRP